MIISKLSGGLGNQLFQYALGKHLASINKTDLFLDLSGLSIGFVRPYELEHFNIHAHIAHREDIEKILGSNKVTKKIFKSFQAYLPYGKKKYILEKHSEMFRFIPEILALTSPVYVDGYWQNEKYFAPISTVLRDEYALKKPLPEKLHDTITAIQKTNSVSIHVRRGDYLLSHNKGTFQTYGDEYINGAIDYISSHVKNPHFFFFSDDITWVKENISLPFPTTYVSFLNTKPHEDLILMSMCNHNIIANSSFSWWGAWLNKHENKIIIAPKKWINDKAKNSDDLIPNTWIRL